MECIKLGIFSNVCGHLIIGILDNKKLTNSMNLGASIRMYKVPRFLDPCKLNNVKLGPNRS
eukprot:snap_masked-scaffold_51-processed-gene-1.44-mRNA-1 protein AED:1.00 eAED:1.00 QI:0/0/0/0/1/1/2/0/60